ncbi:MAG: isoprenylcysteine carboxylmethyltransferase family protein [Gammaproteobacteria bacterium]|jgi:protein-S-isoprenylcysteine O-methyltransferase Ste14
MKRLTLLLYSVLSYCVFFGTFLYLIGFIGNLFVPKSIDSAPTMPLAPALAINVGLLGLFAVQHSLMARSFFKDWLTKFIPQAAERSTYVLASSLALLALVAFWQPMGGVVWMVESTPLVVAIYALFALGWLLVLVSTFSINHFDLFGLRQAWINFTGKAYEPLEFRLPLLYRIVRHPLYCGFFLAIWATPTMTTAHLVFALLSSAYIVIGTMLEERDLRRTHPEYAEYARNVPRYIPRLGRSKAVTAQQRA